MTGTLNNTLTIERTVHHVLLVSRDSRLTEHLKTILPAEDYHLTFVDTPRQAGLRVLCQSGIGVLIFDGRAQKNSKEEFQYMRQELDQMRVPMLMLLDPEDESQWQLIHDHQIDDFVLKPIQADELSLRLKGLLWRKEMESLAVDRQWPDLFQGFIDYVQSDLESKFETGESATVALLEVRGAWESMVEGQDMCDQLTSQLHDHLTGCLSRTSRVVRYGRVTLTVYIPGATNQQAREQLEETEEEFFQQTGLLFWYGLASHPRDGTSVTELVLSAERALSRARARGMCLVNPDQQPGGYVSLGSPKILIADDDPYLAALLQATFQALGYRIILADNGRDAIEAIHREEPDLVILDNLMPTLSGFELLEQLRSYYHDRLPVHVIMLTIMTQSNDVLRGYELGVEDYIGKPFDPRELIARVERVLALSYSHKRVAAL